MTQTQPRTTATVRFPRAKYFRTMLELRSELTRWREAYFREGKLERSDACGVMVEALEEAEDRFADFAYLW